MVRNFTMSRISFWMIHTRGPNVLVLSRKKYILIIWQPMITAISTHMSIYLYHHL